MAKKCGRPIKVPNKKQSNREKIIGATIELIKENRADNITVRNVCAKANISTGTFYHYFKNKDDLLMEFLRETDFKSGDLEAPLSQPALRQAELYTKLIDRYRELGIDFVKSFYTPGNSSLSAYMCQNEGRFAPDSIMEVSEAELKKSKEAGFLPGNLDLHTCAADLCTIIKGCVFEWLLKDGDVDVNGIIERIFDNYMSLYSKLKN